MVANQLKFHIAHFDVPILLKLIPMNFKEYRKHKEVSKPTEQALKHPGGSTTECTHNHNSQYILQLYFDNNSKAQNFEQQYYKTRHTSSSHVSSSQKQLED